jgi:hypothetical protein
VYERRSEGANVIVLHARLIIVQRASEYCLRSPSPFDMQYLPRVGIFYSIVRVFNQPSFFFCSTLNQQTNEECNMTLLID